MRKMLNYAQLKDIVRNIISKRVEEQAEIEKVFYYEAYPEDGTREYSLDGKHKFMTWLKKGLGFEVRKKPIKQIKVEEGERSFIREKGNMDTEITIDAVHHQKKYNIAVFFTGDSDFYALIKYLMAREKRCFVFSSRNNISEELRTGTNGYFEIMNIPELWGSALKYRDQKNNLCEEVISWI